MIPRPRFTVKGVQLSQKEMRALCAERATYWQQIARELDAVKDYHGRSDAVAEAENQAGRTVEADTIKNGAVGYLATVVSELETLADSAGTTPVKVRKDTLRKIYNHSGGTLRGDVSPQNTILRTSNQIPGWIFDQIDTNSDGELSVEEISTYWNAL